MKMPDGKLSGIFVYLKYYFKSWDRAQKSFGRIFFLTEHIPSAN